MKHYVEIFSGVGEHLSTRHAAEKCIETQLSCIFIFSSLKKAEEFCKTHDVPTKHIKVLPIN